MPATAKKRRKKTKNKRNVELPERSTWVEFSAAIAGGAILGLSAPGLDQWLLAWVGLVPLLLLIAGSKNMADACFKGVAFGTAYNLVYLNWYLSLAPLNWLGFNDWQGLLLSGAAWLIVSIHQGLIIGLFAGLFRLIPLTGGFLPRKLEERWHLPSLFLIPLIWVLIENKVGNAPDALGVPWSMIEYSQYKCLPLLQAASWVGGIGISFLIVATNVAIAGLLATLSRKATWKSLAAETTGVAVRQVLSIALLIAVTYGCGLSSLTANHPHPTTSLSIVQGNINIDMQKTEHRFTLTEILSRYLKMMDACPKGICVLTESAIPAYLREQPETVEVLTLAAKHRQLDLVVGAMDRDSPEHPYNSAYGINSQGQFLTACYHKRLLVPFGEYTPYLVQYLPDWLRKLTNTPSGGGFSAGKEPAVLPLTSGRLAPLICFETLSPELVASSARSGGGLLVNISDLAWFHDSQIGKQMLAFSVLRAVESGRYFVFAANSGPSAIVDPNGRITASSKPGQKTVLTGKVGYSSQVTPFCGWFR
jgi:apolipoprotein N-acyltransferase